ncbi:uncharacterized protein [Diadema setosum]|uniref:uncharacterized protein n=1 Tax=Diadema setosum TaxID=31175 RepID=UPI003B3A603F
MPNDKPPGKSKQGDGAWTNRLRGASPATPVDTDPQTPADHRSETLPLTMTNVKETLQAQIKEALCSDDIIERMQEVITDAILEKVTQSVYEAISLDLAQLKAEQHSVNAKLKALENDISKVQHDIEEQEQYSRRECLRFYGIPETKDENTDAVITDVVKKHLGITLQSSCIARSHRITPSSRQETERQQTPKPIIVKFAVYNTRQIVYDAKSRFKGSPIFVHEDLTLQRRSLVNAAAKKSSVKRVWTKDGKITALVKIYGKDDKRVPIRNMSDIERLQ